MPTEYLCLPTETSERMGVIFLSISFIILADAHFSHDTPRHSVLDLPFACCPRAREPGSAPPNRRTSEVRKKTPEIDLPGTACCGSVYPASALGLARINTAVEMNNIQGDRVTRYKSTAIKKTADGSTYLDPRQFHEYLDRKSVV